MNYTSEQAIELYSQYQIYLLKYDLNNESVKGTLDFDPFTFENWLKDKESSQTPVKGQMIWVRTLNFGYSFAGKWLLRKFKEFNKDEKIVCGIFDEKPNDSSSFIWDEYSLTDPNL